ELHLEIDGEGALALVAFVPQVRQRRRIALRPGRLRDAERRQGLGGDDPGRDGGVEALGEERAERLVLPGLDVPGRPVVEETEPGDAPARLADRDGLPLIVALADPNPELQLVVQPLRWTEGRRLGVRHLRL